MTFEVTVGEITSSSIAYTVTPSDLKAEYLCILADAKTVESFTRDEFLVEAILEELKAEAGAQGKTLAEYMPEIVDKGAITDGKFSNLSPASKYYIILFGVDPANGYKANSDVVKKDVTTEEFQDLNITFEVKTTVDGNSATFKIIPSNNDDVWYFTTLPKATYDTYTDPAGQYKMETRQFMLFCLQQEIEARRQQGMSDTEIMNAIFQKGTRDAEFLQSFAAWPVIVQVVKIGSVRQQGEPHLSRSGCQGGKQGMLAQVAAQGRIIRKGGKDGKRQFFLPDAQAAAQRRAVPHFLLHHVGRSRSQCQAVIRSQDTDGGGKQHAAVQPPGQGDSNAFPGEKDGAKPFKRSLWRRCHGKMWEKVPSAGIVPAAIRFFPPGFCNHQIPLSGNGGGRA